MILKLAYHIQKQNFMKCILLFKREEINIKYGLLKQISCMGSLSNGNVCCHISKFRQITSSG
jgi:hypothetical protein